MNLYLKNSFNNMPDGSGGDDPDNPKPKPGGPTGGGN